MFNFFKKLIFYLKKPQIIIVVGQGRQTTVEAIFQLLNKHFEVRKINNDILPLVKKNEILIFESEVKDSKVFESLIKKSRLTLLVVSRLGEYHPEREFFAGPAAEALRILKLVEVLPIHSYLILNFDDETVRDIKNKTKAHPLTFGFGARANLKASDIVLTQTPTFGTNFKINYEGNIVPIWLENLFGKDQIYSALSAASVGEVLGLNLVEISTALKSYQSLPGRMKLIKGIKNSWILDDSESASPFLMMEALEILRKIESKGRKIAVLGDILGIGKYAIEAHETVGEKVKNSANLLFTVGDRAKFFAQGAQRRGMSEDRIRQFNEREEVAKALQDEIKEGDLILVDGSKEMKMSEIVKKIKAVD